MRGVSRTNAGNALVGDEMKGADVGPRRVASMLAKNVHLSIDSFEPTAAHSADISSNPGAVLPYASVKT